MPHVMPDVAAPFKAQMPSTHKLWWMRGLVLSSQHVAADEGLGTVVPKIITKVQVFDIDSGNGHDLMLMGEGYDFAEGDCVSLFGHETIDAQSPTDARLIINHNTGNFDRAFPEYLFYPAGWHFGDFKNRLACKTVLTSSQKNKKIFLLIGAFLLSAIVTSGATLILGMVLLMFGLPMVLGIHLMKSMAHQPTFSGEKKRTAEGNLLVQFGDYLNTKYQNVTPIYENLARTMHNWVEQNPDNNTEKKFVAVPRGNKSRSQLVE